MRSVSKGNIMILLFGIRSEEPLALVAAELVQCGTEFVILNQRELSEFEGVIEFCGGRLSGWFEHNRRMYSIADFIAMYVRPMDDSQLPECSGLPPQAPA